MLKPSSVIRRRAARAGSSVGSTGAGRTACFHSRCSGRKVTQGERISTKEKPGWRTACAISAATPFGSPEKPRAMKLAPEARAITSGWNSRRPVPPGASLDDQSGSVVGEGWPLVMP
jgi:hypothetical protein